MRRSTRSRDVDISAGGARRVALAAQGFGRPRPGAPNLGHVRRLLTARTRTLLVPGAFTEPGATVAVDTVAAELASELRELAGWLELDPIDVADHGDPAATLRRQLGSTPAGKGRLGGRTG